jgi:hypothetical protein
MNRILLIAASLLLTVSAFADTSTENGIIPSQLLNTTNDGAGSDVQSLLAASGAIVDLQANQTANRIFMQNGDSMTWNFEWARAGLAGKHRLGWYSVEDPTKITWVLGNRDQNGTQFTTWTGSIDGLFGTVLDNGAGQLFFSDSSLNTDSALSSSNPALNGFDRRIHVGVFNPTNTGDVMLTWEDLKNQTEVAAGGLLDYNDYGHRLSNVNAVPEPGTMIALGAGAAALMARRKKKNAAKA